jgi:hypothetical protein
MLAQHSVAQQMLYSNSSMHQQLTTSTARSALRMSRSSWCLARSCCLLATLNSRNCADCCCVREALALCASTRSLQMTWHRAANSMLSECIVDCDVAQKCKLRAVVEQSWARQLAAGHPQLAQLCSLLLSQSGRGLAGFYTIPADGMLKSSHSLLSRHCRCDVAQDCWLSAVVEQSWALLLPAGPPQLAQLCNCCCVRAALALCASTRSLQMTR